jgi:S-layer homology domain
MTSSPPDPDSRRDSRRNEEPIAVIVALLSMGGIFLWSVNQKQPGFDLFSLGKPAVTASPTVSPTISPTIAPSASVPVAPSPIATPTAGTNGLNVTPASPSVAPARPVPLVLPGATVQPEASGAAPVPAPAPTQTAGVRFSDVAPDYWATPFIVALSQRGIIRGFEDSTFLPNKPVTRAEFAAMLQKAFEDQPKLRQSLDFKDLPATYWARPAIDETFQTGFLNGYPDNVFLPNQEIPKVQALTALANGLKLKTAGVPSEVLKSYQDAAQIPPYAVDRVAAATEAGMVVNYPDRGKLNPNQVITRADAAALIYQALVSAGKAEKIPSNYIVPR